MNFLEKLKNMLFGKPEQKPAKPASKPVQRETYVFVTLKGKKFHYDPCCPSILNAKSFKMDLSKAKASGRKACDKCCYKYLHD